jgi:hypothetical protein
MGKCTEPEFSCKRFKSPRIDSKESISDEGLYVALLLSCLLHTLYTVYVEKPTTERSLVSLHSSDHRF